MADRGSSKLTSKGVVVGVSGSARSADVIDAAARLADALGTPFEAVYVETAKGDDPQRKANAAQALSRALELGAAVATIPASTVADGLAEHLSSTGASHLVLGYHPARGFLSSRRPALIDQLVERGSQAELLLVPDRLEAGRRRWRGGGWLGTPWEYAVALMAIGITAAAAALLRETTDVISTSILFLFPVIAVAARSGLGPTLFAVATAVLGHNLLFLEPAFSFDALAVQSWIMAAVLLVGGSYTSILTSSLRDRVTLSDRSARESSRLANFAQRLTRMSDWASTGAAVCEEISTMLHVDTVIFREVDGKLAKVADYPRSVTLDPIDEIALRWVWEHGDKSGTETTLEQPGNWQFYPLSTSLGVLAVVGLSREDAHRPVTADQTVLLSTLLAQASLAHERLRLEDQMRSNSRKPE